ncbi:hypothetical protein PoB_001668200, partial [Plakobranchus ocellatus]
MPAQHTGHALTRKDQWLRIHQEPEQQHTNGRNSKRLSNTTISNIRISKIRISNIGSVALGEPRVAHLKLTHCRLPFSTGSFASAMEVFAQVGEYFVELVCPLSIPMFLPDGVD